MHFLFVTYVKVNCHFLLHVNAINTPNHLHILKDNIILIVLSAQNSHINYFSINMYCDAVTL